PVANDDSYTMDENTMLDVDADDGLLANDTHATSYEVISYPKHAKLFGGGLDGSFIYQAQDNYNGTDTFTYVATGPGGTSAPATVTITITPQDAPPIANFDFYATDQDQLLTVDAANGVLKNDTDATTATLVDDAGHGT